MAAADPADADSTDPEAIDPGPGAPDPGEVVLGDLELTRAVTVQLTAIGVLGLVVSWALLAGLYQTVAGHPVSLQFAPAGVDWWTDALSLLVVPFLAAAVLVPHEWLHGLAIRHYGGEPSYGVGVAHFVLPYAYATTDHEFDRNQFVVVLLTPLAVLTAVGVPLVLALGWGWLIVPLAANAAGAVADVWMAATLLSYPSHVRLEDHASGVRILGRHEDAPSQLSIGALAWDALSGAAVSAVGLLLALAVGGPFLLPALGVDRLTVGTPDTPTFLFAFVNGPTEISMSVGPAVLAVGAVLGLAYAFLRSHRRRKRETAPLAPEPVEDR